MTKLAAAAALTHKLPFRLHLLADRFFVRHLRLANIGDHLEFAAHPVDDDLQMQLAHTADDRLPGLLVRGNPQCGIFLGELVHRFHKLVLIGFCLGFDRHVDHRVREGHLLENDRIILVA